MTVLTPNCPTCSSPPALIFGDTRFCGNEDCKTLSWMADKDLDYLLTHTNFVDLNVDREEE